MNTSIVYRKAEPKDYKEVIKVLTDCHLPVADLYKEKLNTFIVALSENRIVGTAGIEVNGEHALLRSVAVLPDFRGQKLAEQLLNQILLVAEKHGVKELHLLTTTAEVYFSEKGFVRSDRNEAPESIRNSEEFADLCPSTSAYMSLSLV